jgi:hypothetical protein
MRVVSVAGSVSRLPARRKKVECLLENAHGERPQDIGPSSRGAWSDPESVQDPHFIR